VPTEALRAALGPELAKQAEADFEAPVMEASSRHPEVRAKRASKGDGRNLDDPGRSFFEARQGRAPQDDGERSERAARKKPRRRDRTGGPRPKYPRPKS